ncbi:hypothetical protein [Spirosoma daeguense]
MEYCKLILAVIFLANHCSAQTQKGNRLISGSLSLNYNRQKEPLFDKHAIPDNVIIKWNPIVSATAGRFWKDNWLMGLSLSGSSSTYHQSQESSSFESTNKSSQSAFTVTPFVRRYWAVQSVYLFAGAGLSLNSYRATANGFVRNLGTITVDDQSNSGFSVNPRLEVGLTYFLANRLGIQLVASADALPINAAGVSAGLIYSTGSVPNNRASDESNSNQLQAGKWVLEGSFGMGNGRESRTSSAGTYDYSSNSQRYMISPSIGFFLKNRNLIGVALPFTYSTTNYNSKNQQARSDEWWQIGITPYFQHYWAAARLTPYTRISTGYVYSNNIASRGSSINAGIDVGLAYMAGQRFNIETSLASANVTYAWDKLTSSELQRSNWGAGVKGGISGNIAIRYVFQ